MYIQHYGKERLIGIYCQCFVFNRCSTVPIVVWGMRRSLILGGKREIGNLVEIKKRDGSCYVLLNKVYVVDEIKEK